MRWLAVVGWLLRYLVKLGALSNILFLMSCPTTFSDEAMENNTGVICRLGNYMELSEDEGKEYAVIGDRGQ
ncbi:hypothetical protein Tco_0435407 [Tanacetum coccineum]